MPKGPIDVYLLPGLYGTSRLFSNLIDATPDWANPFAIGYSPKIEKSYEDLARDVLAQIDPRRPYIVVGESFSGPVATLVAADAKVKPAALIFSASFISNPYTVLKFSPDQTIGWIVRSSLWILNVRTFRDPLLSQAQSAMRETSVKVMEARVRAIRDTDTSRQLASLPCQVVCLKAINDKVVPPKAQERIARVRPDTITAEIGRSHLLLQKHPVQAWSAIENALDCAR